MEDIKTFSDLKNFIDNGGDVNIQNEDKNTFLHIAVKEGNLEMIEYLISKGANVNVQNVEGCTPLYFAVISDNLEIIEYLISKGADVSVNIQNNAGNTPLHEAVKKGNLKIIKYLVDHGAYAYIGNDKGETPLHFAASLDKNLDVLKYFIDTLKSDIDVRTNHNSTPLLYALNYDNLKAGKYLVSRGADINAQNNDTLTPLFVSAYKGNLDMIKHLICKGANINHVTNKGNTILHYASLGGNIDTVRYFIERHPNVSVSINVINNQEDTPLHYASVKGYLDIIKYLVEQGADFDIQNEDGNTPLYYAVKNEQLEVVKYLVEQKADVNVHNDQCNTPLHLASEKNNLDIVKYLVDHGAQINILNRNKEIPLFTSVIELASIKDYDDSETNIDIDVEEKSKVFEYLLDKGALKFECNDKVKVSLLYHISQIKNKKLFKHILNYLLYHTDGDHVTIKLINEKLSEYTKLIFEMYKDARFYHQKYPGTLPIALFLKNKYDKYNDLFSDEELIAISTFGTQNRPNIPRDTEQSKNEFLYLPLYIQYPHLFSYLQII